MAKKVELNDIEMKPQEAEKDCTDSVPTEKKFENDSFIDLISLSLSLMQKSIVQNDNRLLSKAFRCMNALTKEYDSVKFLSVFEFIIKNSTGSEYFEFASDILNCVKACIDLECKKMDFSMNKLEDCDNLISQSMNSLVPQFSSGLREYTVFLGIITLKHFAEFIKLSKSSESSDFKAIEKLGDILIDFVKSDTRHSMDLLYAKVYFYYARLYELQGKLIDIRKKLLRSYRTAILHHNHMIQATCFNLYLRSYIKSGLFDLALIALSKMTYPESLRSNAQQARYLYYTGIIHAMQLEYGQAHNRLIQAIRKAPHSKNDASKSFRVSAQKFAIIVELLMGDIPERQLFNSIDMRKSLSTYLKVVISVRTGDILGFQNVMKLYEKEFLRDTTLSLIQRLHHNVIRTGLRMITSSYSCISLKDIAEKFGFDSIDDTECIVSKAIADGVVDAIIDNDEKCLRSKKSVDPYTTSEPMKAFHKRSAFCLLLHNDAVKAMHYPDEIKNVDYVNQEEERRLRQEQIQSVGSDDDALI